ncbi:MAG TPA: hypothetical protein VGB05_06455 [Pyrinomonadaceae bacterium]|jgi:hypothetical protein
MRKIAFIILGLSAAVTLLSPIIWFAGLILGIGGGLIHLFLILTPFGILGLVVGAVLLLLGRRDAQT